ncbi:NADP-dependent oxidoreductase domain-containing protein [Aspergillus bertholletiae]|uniref:NADP-dependent oxidoreductase domain-containing protein n=1 Tax=Aspergillus bertholletiae TaxID=1226010 RepID=A0A5N7BAP0_9EURO|nr:NADP-dependent oxidoreductase domain-containing protein [Aspergillus bertholletiae]
MSQPIVNLGYCIRALGRDGPEVPAVGLGLMKIGGTYGPAGGLDKNVAFLEHAHVAGQRFWDTADMYANSEVGKWVKLSGKRYDILLATKFAIKQEPEVGFTVRSDPDYAKQACEKSLQRLIVEAMVGYSAFALDIESLSVKLLATCRELGIAVVAYSPVSRGILIGEIQSPTDFPESDFCRMAPKYSEENFPQIMELGQGLKSVAQGPDIFPIPRTRSTKRVDDNTASALLQLTDKEVQDIQDLMERTEIPSTRYPAI